MHPIWWEWCQLSSARRLRTERGTIRDISWLRGPPCGGLPHEKEGAQRRAHQPFLMQCHHRINQGRQGRINQGQLLPSWDRAPHHHCFQVGSSNALEQGLDGWSNKWIMSDGPCPGWRPGWITQKHSWLMKTAQDRGNTKDFLDTAPGLRRQSNTQLKWVYSDDGLIGPHLCQIRVALTCMTIFIGSLPPFFSLRPGLKWVRHSTSATNGTYRWWYRYPSTICIAFHHVETRKDDWHAWQKAFLWILFHVMREEVSKHLSTGFMPFLPLPRSHSCLCTVVLVIIRVGWNPTCTWSSRSIHANIWMWHCSLSWIIHKTQTWAHVRSWIQGSIRLW